MKKNVFVFLLFFMMPAVVSAKTYNIEDLPISYHNNTPPYETSIIVFEPGDVIRFSNSFPNISIEIDGNYSSSCYGGNDCLSTYVVDQKMVFGLLGYSSDFYYGSLVLKTIDDDVNIYLAEDLKEGHIYQSNDIIVSPYYHLDTFYYDEYGNELDDVWSGGILIEISELYDDQTNQSIPVTWQLSFGDAGIYAPYSLIFQIFHYVEPSFRLSCDKDEISFGEKSSCSLFATSMQQLKSVSFGLDMDGFMVSNAKSANHVEFFDGDLDYNLRVADGYGVDDEELLLMTFDIEGTQNESYVDDIVISNIFYTDAVYEGSYDNITSDLKVKYNSLANPKTNNNIFMILLPIIILISILGIYRIPKKV